MMGKTHLAAGLAVSLAIAQPDTPAQCLAAVMAGALGGVLADSDTIDDDNRPDALAGQFVAAGSIAAGSLIDYVFRFGICQSVAANPSQVAAGLVLFVTLYAIGFLSKHRSFTHSLLALALYSGAIALIYPPATLCFAGAYLSHLLLDLTNKKKVPLLYPLHPGFCLGWFYAGKTANTVIMASSFTLAVVLLAASVIRIALG